MIEIVFDSLYSRNVCVNHILNPRSNYKGMCYDSCVHESRLTPLNLIEKVILYIMPINVENIRS